jgi:hypothetical protein
VVDDAIPTPQFENSVSNRFVQSLFSISGRVQEYGQNKVEALNRTSIGRALGRSAGFPFAARFGSSFVSLIDPSLTRLDWQ